MPDPRLADPHDRTPFIRAPPWSTTPTGRRHPQAFGAGTTGRSHTQIVFDALNATHDRLAQLAAGAGRATDPVPDGLFVAQQSGRRLHAEDQVQVSIRPNPTNLDVIDRLAATHTAGNRSALVALALHEYLPPEAG